MSMFRRAESVEASYDALILLLTKKDRLPIITNISRSFNCEVRDVAKNVKDIFESMEKNSEPTLLLVVPSYYLLQKKKLAVSRSDSKPIAIFETKLQKYIDEKFWTSIIRALHWMTCFLDPTFKTLILISYHL